MTGDDDLGYIHIHIYVHIHTYTQTNIHPYTSIYIPTFIFIQMLIDRDLFTHIHRVDL